MSASTPLITDPLEAISKWLPRQATQIRANEHTWRMLSARTGRGLVNKVVGPEADLEGPHGYTYGYLWGRNLLIGDQLPDGMFCYERDGEALGHVAIGGTCYAYAPAGEPFYTFNVALKG